ncbi:phosphate acyltransferase PlsX [Paralimibaculum aggregatum]|uniref:Phosphate acyltransferase n=1 Tax=Paralimibaculum aggregatum TaxID=3036245 RepID=A0ABQ6LMK7_9RHOB|nr:phosphate acyltransferase PlsX [Limibaculum sp. NKW23]GMG81681.1 phosphate acyltransferase PlsX [Limibaculum sp. NKW23]
MAPETVLSIDAMGGDRGPAPLIGALDRVARKRSGLRFLLHGRAEELEPLLRRRSALVGRYELRDCPGLVRMDDPPTRSLRDRRDTSMWQCLEAVSRGEAAVAVSAGNTGTLLAMAVLILRRAPGVARPAIAVHWPAARPEGYTIALDVGANLSAEPAHLAQYALMGAEYARISFGVDAPRVGLLNIGTEETKGPDRLRETAALISDAATRTGRFAYHGFVEGTDLSGNRVDVVVTDGFTGNIALKTGEGTAGFVRQTLTSAFRHSWLTRFASMFAVTTLMRLRQRIDPRRVNGGVFLGLRGTVVKSHGGADAVGFVSAIELAAQMAETEFTQRVAKQLGKLDIRRATGPGGPQNDDVGA